ncbi:hypothetical protein [Herbidospora mongoliensis]|uniref:hypothetical protein n=1 Tax=Herbidospora mongoliensis TaxID=688067 RepID=UPI000B158986|nr:hypothetical protein [Herbidospora mongoliensis]
MLKPRTPKSTPAAEFPHPTGTFRQRAELTKPQRDILAKLDIPTPKKICRSYTRRRRLTRHNTHA